MFGKSPVAASLLLFALLAGAGEAPAAKGTEGMEGESGKPKKEAVVCYIPWHPEGYKMQEYMTTCFDFPLLRSQEESLEAMSRYGWTGAALDFIVDRPGSSKAHLAAFERSLAISERLPGFKILPLLEQFKDPKIVDEEMRALLKSFGDSPRWLKYGGRQAFLTYSPAVSPEYWSKLLDGFADSPWRPFMIFDFNGLEVAVQGSFNVEKNRPYMKIFDGAYAFGSLKMPVFQKLAKESYSKERPELLIGASVGPGYLNSGRNFVSPRGTLTLRERWEGVLAEKPDFIHFTTWNDIGEATHLCPSFSCLSSRLEISQRYLCEYFGRSLPEGDAQTPELVLSYRKCLYQGEPLSVEALPLPTLKGPAKGKLSIKLLDAKGELLAEAKSPELDFKRLEPWTWDFLKPFERGEIKRVSVKASCELPDGRRIDYANLPDIAIAAPLSYSDQLYYSVPLHRLAGPERGVEIKINGRTGESVGTDGLAGLSYEFKGPTPPELSLAVAKNGRQIRFPAPLDAAGAELNPDDPKAAQWTDARLPAEMAKAPVLDLTPSLARGQDCYSALAIYPDGKFAYSPSVWSLPAIPADCLAAQWLFVPASSDERNLVKDRSGRGRDLKLKEPKDWSFVRLGGNARALAFNGKSNVLEADPYCVPNGPATLEAVFRYEPTGSSQVLAYQRGAQAALLLDPQGRLAGWRLPELRSYPGQFAELRSEKPLKPGVFHQAVLRWTGKSLELFVDGKFEGSKPCLGTRSCEGFSIGGPPGGGEELLRLVDNLTPDSFFKGEMLRMGVYAKALSDEEIEGLYERCASQEFFKEGR